jgi:hypothetical protein
VQTIEVAETQPLEVHELSEIKTETDGSTAAKLNPCRVNESPPVEGPFQAEDRVSTGESYENEKRPVLTIPDAIKVGVKDRAEAAEGLQRMNEFAVHDTVAHAI